LSEDKFPLVSIITPVFNGAKYIEELILSVQAQDYSHIEHIIIDDGSQDETDGILKKYPHLRWWSHENRGQYATMNEGLEAAKGKFLCFISADDLLLPKAVGKVVDYMLQHVEYDGITGRTLFIDEAGAPYPIRFPFQNAPLKFYPFFSQVSHCSMFVKRESLVKHRLFFNPALHYVGDYDWILCLLSKLKVSRISDHLSKVRIHTEQTSVRYKQAMSEEKQRVVDTHHINRIFYVFFTGIFIVIHNYEKLKYALNHGGLREAWRLIDRRLRRPF
jgi:glycosyltransferase involved in cell wall biosynthesis